MSNKTPPDKALDREYRTAIAASLKMMAESVELILDGFWRNKPEPLAEGEKLLKRADKSELALTQKLLDTLGEEEPEDRIGWAADLREAMGHVGGITRPLKRLREAVSQKVKKRVLFSDKAIRELNTLFNAAQNVLLNAGDGLITRNPTLTSHVTDGANRIFRLLSDYSTEHEERMVRGVCSIESSTLFLDMLDQFRSVAHHSKEIGNYAAMPEPSTDKE